MSSIFSLIWLAVVIYAIIDILKSGGSTGKKALWIVLVLVLPLIGLIAWFLIGRK